MVYIFLDEITDKVILNSRDRDKGWTPAHLAAKANNRKALCAILEAMLKARLTPSVLDKEGRTYEDLLLPPVGFLHDRSFRVMLA